MVQENVASPLLNFVTYPVKDNAINHRQQSYKDKYFLCNNKNYNTRVVP